jgi:hypothetical protein
MRKTQKLAINHRNDDIEEKWVVAPAEISFSKEEIKSKSNLKNNTLIIK